MNELDLDLDQIAAEHEAMLRRRFDAIQQQQQRPRESETMEVVNAYKTQYDTSPKAGATDAWSTLQKIGSSFGFNLSPTSPLPAPPVKQ